MGHQLALVEPRTVVLQEYEDPPLSPGEVRLRTLYSGISAGTELTSYRGTNPHIQKRWDAERRLFVSSNQDAPRYPITNWGYEEVGEIIECGSDVSAVQEGDIVFGTWGHRTHHVLDEVEARKRVLPAGLDPILGIFSHVGSVALNGVHDAGIRIGETVAVFGLGVVGQIVAQLAQASGARVIGVDLIEERLSLAQTSGAVDVAIRADHESVADRIQALTDGRGADVSIEVAGSATALHEAIRATAYSSTVVTMGFFQGEARGLFLGEEFHHNRINLICSQISGVAPELSYRWDRMRLAHTVMLLQQDDVLQLMSLITRKFPLERAGEAFRMLDTEPAEALQVVLDFSHADSEI